MVLPCSGECLTFLVVDVLFFFSLSLDDDDEVDTSAQDIFIIDNQPMKMGDGKMSEQQEVEEEEVEDLEKCVETIDENESVTASKSANVSNKNRSQNEGEESSEDSEDEDDIMIISSHQAESSGPARCITALAR